MKKTNSQPLKFGTSSQKLKDRKEFLQLLAEKLAFVYKLNATEAKVLFFCFANLTYENIVFIDGTFRKNIQNGISLSQSTITKALQNIIEKKILQKVDVEKQRNAHSAYIKNSYFLNPDIVGENPFQDLEKITLKITLEFGVHNLEYTTSMEITKITRED